MRDYFLTCLVHCMGGYCNHADGDSITSKEVIQHCNVGCVVVDRVCVGLRQFSPCVYARDIAAARVPISLVTGWVDQSATSALHILHHAARMPGAITQPLSAEC